MTIASLSDPADTLATVILNDPAATLFTFIKYEPAVPARYQDVIISRSEYYVHQLRSNIEAASMKHQEYEKKIERMRIDLINKPAYMRSTAITSGTRSNTRHPKYF